jgi:hypothetical protein
MKQAAQIAMSYSSNNSLLTFGAALFLQQTSHINHRDENKYKHGLNAQTK